MVLQDNETSLHGVRYPDNKLLPFMPRGSWRTLQELEFSSMTHRYAIFSATGTTITFAELILPPISVGGDLHPLTYC